MQQNCKFSGSRKDLVLRLNFTVVFGQIGGKREVFLFFRRMSVSPVILEILQPNSNSYDVADGDL